MVRKNVTSDDVSRATLGTREKGACDPYQDPTQVPLVKKTKACRHYPGQGNSAN